MRPMGIARRPDLNDIDVDTCLANLHRIADIQVMHPMRRPVIDLREPTKTSKARKADARVLVDVDDELAKYHAGV
jgi:hypothetical protein